MSSGRHEGIASALAAGVVLGDGANGTCLAEAGFVKRPYDLACLEAPELVRCVHRDYFEAGVDFVETNTFESNPIRLGSLSARAEELNRAGAALAREAARGLSDRFVLGAIGPCGKAVEPIGAVPLSEVRASVLVQARALLEGGVDGFMLETFVDVGELETAIRAVRELTDAPIFATRAFVEDGETLAEGLPTRFARRMSDLPIQATGANCAVGPQRMLDLVRMLSEGTDLPIVAFPTPGVPQLVKGRIVYDATPAYFAAACARLVDAGAAVVGGCCGATPAHLAELRRALDSGGKKVRPHAAIVREAREKVALAETPPTMLARKLAAGEFITAIELDVPRGLKLDRLLAAASTLKAAGADVINISDGARARLRMTPTAVGRLVQEQAEMEVVMHFSCRDRNLLAIQADLLGAHALGVRNILAVTGDPANVGDYPSATSVFDVDSIGLVRILSRFNEGLDLAGYSVGVKCGFTIAVAFNPLAPELELELDRLARKVDAGAQLVYTQPLFAQEYAEAAAEACARLGVPWLLGILPLRNARHAEFMHNEVPGVRIPDALRAKIADSSDDEDALKVGMEHAGSLARAARKLAAGVYVMPPFGSAESALAVMAAGAR